MGDMGDIYRDWKEHRKQQKDIRMNLNIEKILSLSPTLQFTYRLYEATGQIAIQHGSYEIDFFTTTGTWIVRGKKLRGHGFNSLRKFLSELYEPAPPA